MTIPFCLGKDGLTITSANHIANIAKEMYENLEAKLISLKFVNRDFTLAINGETYRIENESTLSDFASGNEFLKEISSLKALIAWLREGIKAKEKLTSTDSENAFIAELIKSGRKDLDIPDYGPVPSFETVLSSRPADTQARYFSLEAKCASYGKFIHPDGHFAIIRTNFYNKLKNPTSIVGRGQEAEINTYSSDFTSQDVDSIFFSLQKKYRSAQAEFNALKAELDNSLGDETRDYLNKKELLFETWKNIQSKERLAYQEKIKTLKIIIPESLYDIFKKVNSVAVQK